MQGTALSSVLLLDIKFDQDITWSDTVTDRKIENYITQGMFYINNKLGAEGDYLKDGYPRTLLFEYVRYARSGALDVFENNYRSMILAMQNDRKVKAYAEKNAVSTGQ